MGVGITRDVTRSTVCPGPGGVNGPRAACLKVNFRVKARRRQRRHPALTATPAQCSSGRSPPARPSRGTRGTARPRPRRSASSPSASSSSSSSVIDDAGLVEYRLGDEDRNLAAHRQSDRVRRSGRHGDPVVEGQFAVEGALTEVDHPDLGQGATGGGDHVARAGRG